MNLVSLVEKLIKEHGSSSILRDHLALFKDKAIILEEENESLKSESKILQSKVKQLEEDNSKLRSEIKVHNNGFHNDSSDIEEQEINILKLLASDVNVLKEISDSLKIGQEVASFYLHELTEKKLISSKNIPMVGEWWSLEQSGRKLLINRKLIS